MSVINRPKPADRPGSRAAAKARPGKAAHGKASPGKAAGRNVRGAVVPDAADPAPRWRRRKGARPAEIVEAALACFTERGFAATRLEEIAARAGVTRGTLYLYFPNKEELFKAVVRQSIVPLLARAEAMIEAAESVPTPELLRRLVTSFADAPLGTPASAIPKLVIAEAGNFPDLARFYLDTVIKRGRRLVRALLERGIARGEFRKVDTRNAFASVMAPMLFAALWEHSFKPYDDEAMDPAALVRAHADVLLKGLLA